VNVVEKEPHPNYITARVDRRPVVICHYMDLSGQEHSVALAGELEVYITTTKPDLCILSSWLTVDRPELLRIPPEERASLTVALLRASSVTVRLDNSDMQLPRNTRVRARRAWRRIPWGKNINLIGVYEAYAGFASALLEPNIVDELYSLFSGGAHRQIMLHRSLSSMTSTASIGLGRPFPIGYETGRLLDRCKTTFDWHCSAASFLADLVVPPSEYHPEYLHEALGVDLMDVKSGHYFISPRRILSVYDVETILSTKLNLQSWSQQICETVASQLYLLYMMDSELLLSIRSPNGKILNLSKVLVTQRKKQSDLEEFFNFSVATNPIYARHLDVAKRVNGIGELYDSVNTKLEVLRSTLSLEEQRVFSRIAQVLTVVFGAIGVSNVVVAVLRAIKEGLEGLITGALVGFLVSFVLILMAVSWATKRPR